MAIDATGIAACSYDDEPEIGISQVNIIATGLPMKDSLQSLTIAAVMEVTA